MIRRGTPPAAGLWSIPGGRCEPGEPPALACLREVAEETGLLVRIERHAGRVERPGAAGVVFQIDDFVCSVVSGTVHAADDAADARWVSRAELGTLTLVPGLFAALSAWGALPS